MMPAIVGFMPVLDRRPSMAITSGAVAKVGQLCPPDVDGRAVVHVRWTSGLPGQGEDGGLPGKRIQVQSPRLQIAVIIGNPGALSKSGVSARVVAGLTAAPRAAFKESLRFIGSAADEQEPSDAKGWLAAYSRFKVSFTANRAA